MSSPNPAADFLKGLEDVVDKTGGKRPVQDPPPAPATDTSASANDPLATTGLDPAPDKAAPRPKKPASPRPSRQATKTKKSTSNKAAPQSSSSDAAVGGGSVRLGVGMRHENHQTVQQRAQELGVSKGTAMLLMINDVMPSLEKKWPPISTSGPFEVHSVTRRSPADETRRRVGFSFSQQHNATLSELCAQLNVSVGLLFDTAAQIWAQEQGK